MTHIGFPFLHPPNPINQVRDAQRGVDIQKRFDDLYYRYLDVAAVEHSGTVQTSSTSYQDLTPEISVSLKLDAGQFAAIYVTAFTDDNGPFDEDRAAIGLFEPTDISPAVDILVEPISTGSQSATDPLTRTGYGGEGLIGSEWPRGSWIAYLPLVPGIKTYSLRYRHTTGTETAIFSNIRLWAVAI